MDSYFQPCQVPEGQVGEHRIERFEVTKEGASFHNLRCMINDIGHRAVPAGTYTRLMRNGHGAPVMSDTPAEIRDHIEPVERATGHCLIAGLGLGIVAEACLNKPDVTKVTIVERSVDVISLIAPYLCERYEHVQIIHSDIFDFKPMTGTRYGMAWFDIWDDLCGDNLPEMATLSRRFTRFADWYGHWGREDIRRDARQWR